MSLERSSATPIPRIVVSHLISRGAWRGWLPCLLIFGSPVLAAGMAHTVALTSLFLLPRFLPLRIVALATLALNSAPAIVGSGLGGLLVSGRLPIRVTAAVASIALSGAFYLATIHLADDFVPGFGDRFGP